MWLTCSALSPPLCRESSSNAAVDKQHMTVWKCALNRIYSGVSLCYDWLAWCCVNEPCPLVSVTICNLYPHRYNECDVNIINNDWWWCTLCTIQSGISVKDVRSISYLLGGPPVVKKQRDNAIYVTGLALDATESKLSELFGSIGVIKVRTIKTA